MALWVFVFHVAAFSGLTRAAAALRVDIPVDCFIVLSGFVIALLLDRGRESYGLYMGRRLLRLLPVYLAALALAILCLPLYGELLTDARVAPALAFQRERLAAIYENFPAYFALNATLTNGLVPQAVLPFAGLGILSPGWSISLELQYYAVAPFVMGLCTTAKRSILLLVATVVLFYFARKMGFYKPSFLFLRLPLFLVGLFTYRLSTAKNEDRLQWLLALLVSSIACVAVIRTLAPLLWLVTYALLGRATQKPEGGWKLLSALGTRSYSLYILHVPIVWIVERTLQELPFRTPASLALATLVGATPLVLITSALAYRYIERPLIELGKARRPPVAQPIDSATV